MGLASILYFDLAAVPSKLAYYAVNAFYPKQKYFKTLGGKFTIKGKDVHNVFGLEMGGRVIVYREKSNSANNLVKEWKKQFPEAKEGKVSIKMLGDRIKEMDVKEICWFKLHFLVLFYTTLVECHKNQYTNSRILHCIDTVDDIRRLNWCEFIVRILRESTEDWCDLFKNTNSTGPLIFLTALYMDRVEDRKVKFERRWPVIKGLTYEMMKEREKSEISQGHFGLGDILERNNPICKLKSKKGEAEDEGMERSDGGNFETASDVEILAILARLAEKVQRSKQEYERCYSEASTRISIQASVKNTHEALKGGIMFNDDFVTPPHQKSVEPTHEVEDHWSALNFDDPAVENAIIMFERDLDEGNTSSKGHSGDYNSGVCVTEITRNEAESFEINAGTVPAVVGTPNQHIPRRIVLTTPGEIIPYQSAQMVTPVSHHQPVQYTVRLSDASVHRHWKTGGLLNDPVSPHFCNIDGIGVQNTKAAASLQIGGNEVPLVHIAEGAVVALPAVDKNRGKQEINIAVTNHIQHRNTRTRYPGRAISSPFDGAKTDIERNITPLDDKTVQYIFDMKQQANPCLFMWKHYIALKDDFNSLAPGQIATTDVLTVWCIILNHSERIKIAGRPNRFFGTFVQTLFTLDDGYKTVTQRSEDFIHAMRELMDDIDFINLKDVRLAFFPVVYDGHYFLVVFDMHNDTVDVLDNTAMEESIESKYGTSINNLVYNYHYFLKTVGHPKADDILNMSINIVQVPWSTSDDDVDCRVYLMRHAESYHGGGTWGWSTGFKNSVAQRKKQLDKLRKLYLIDMLKWQHNEKRIQVNKETALYIKGEVNKKKSGRGGTKKG